jgi:hypothetical protein
MRSGDVVPEEQAVEAGLLGGRPHLGESGRMRQFPERGEV